MLDMICKALPLTFGAALLTACVTGPDYGGAQVELSPSYLEGQGQGQPLTPQTVWWRAFKDEKLNLLMSAGLEQNLDILQAVERIEEARHQIVVATAGGLPSLTGSGSSIGSGQDGTSRGADASERSLTSQGSVDVSWVLDLFGKYRRNKEAAITSYDAAFANADAARLTLLSDVATEYVSLRLYQQQAAITRDTIDSRRKTLSLTRQKYEAGTGSALEVSQAEGLLRVAEASLPAYEISFKQSAYRIAYLLGDQPDSYLDILRRGAAIPAARFKVNLGVPTDLLRNRPDVRSAERELASATASIGVAAADLYPSLSLTGSVGASAATIAGSAAGASLANGSFGPSVSIPIFNGGQLRAQVKIEESQARQQYLAWRSTVLNAVREVQSALSAYRGQGRQIEASRGSVEAYRRALDLSRQSYDSGASALLDVLDAERSYADARLQLASAEALRATYFITLIVAAGGGYAAEDMSSSRPVLASGKP